MVMTRLMKAGSELRSPLWGLSFNTGLLGRRRIDLLEGLGDCLEELGAVRCGRCGSVLFLEI